MEQNIPKLTVLHICLLLLGAVICYYLSTFINSLLGAVIIYVITRPLVFRLIEKKKWRPVLATSFILFLTFLVILVPATVISLLLLSKVSILLNNYQSFLESIQNQLHFLLERFDLDVTNVDIASELIPFVSRQAPILMNSTATTITQILMMYFILYFMLIENRKFEQWIMQFTPFSTSKTQVILKEFKINIHSNAIGIPLLGLIQGVVAWIGYLIFGVEDAYLWAILTGIFSVIPVIGTTIIWLPVCAYLLVIGHTPQAIGLLLYSIIITTNVDNLVRLILQKKLADVHPLITIFGVILGIHLFGFIGIILGPLIISYFFILIEFYRKDKIEMQEIEIMGS
jgi:predicted PurR-regulated permease PerM